LTAWIWRRGEDYCEHLVKTQNANGSWNGYSYWYGPLAAAWNINILNATRTVEVIPLPAAVWAGLVLMGALGAHRAAQRWRNSR
jgi:hypothetical protein